MKEHFNEKYMESEKYPRAKFQGTITGFDPAKTGVQIVNIAGSLHFMDRQTTSLLKERSKKI